jgi:hypothetical protein
VEIYRHRKCGNCISLVVFFQNQESKLKRTVREIMWRFTIPEERRYGAGRGGGGGAGIVITLKKC